MSSSSSSHTKSHSSVSATSTQRTLQNGLSGEPFNVGIIVAIIIGGMLVFAALIWLATRQRGRWIAQEHGEEYKEMEKKGSLPTYADITQHAPERKRKAHKPLRLLGRQPPMSDPLRALEEGQGRNGVQLARPARSYNHAPGRLQPYQGV